MGRPEVLVPLTLVSGEEELLAARVVEQVVAAAREQEPDADVRTYPGRSVTPEVLLDAATPSLFGELRVLVLDGVADLDEQVRDGLVRLLPPQVPGLSLVLVHRGGVKGKRLLDAVRAAGARVVLCPRPKPRERVAFVEQELAAAGHPATPGAAEAIVDAVGGDLRDLAGACAQLAADVAGTIDDRAVSVYFRGRAEASGFVVADRVIEGDAGAALTELRHAFAAGVDPVMVVAALARQLRAVARVASAGRGASATVARELGLAPWLVDKARRQVTGWDPDRLSYAHRAVAFADGEVKGGGTDPAYAVERAVLQIAACRGTPVGTGR